MSNNTLTIVTALHVEHSTFGNGCTQGRPQGWQYTHLPIYSFAPHPWKLRRQVFLMLKFAK